MPVEELSLEQRNVAIKDPEHLKRWLAQTGRRFMVFNAADLVDALPWPDGHNALLQIIAAYRAQRAATLSDRVEKTTSPTGEGIELQLPKDEFLEVEELDRAIRDLIGEASRKDPNWKLENAPL
jgi:uncharacterized NAD(P)/FAD-binding protein YdhS